MTPTDEYSLPAPQDFDDRAIRKLVRRAVLRTAATAVVWIFLASVLIMGAGRAWATRDSDRFEYVFGTAFRVANPAYSVIIGVGDPGRPTKVNWDLSAEFRGGAQALTVSSFSSVQLPASLTRTRVGKITEKTILPDTRLSRLVDTGAKESSRIALDRLPESIKASAVIEFASPLKLDDFTDFRIRHGMCADMNHDYHVSTQEEVVRTNEWLKESRACKEGTTRLGPLFLEPTGVGAEVFDGRSKRSTPGHKRTTWDDPYLTGLTGWANSLKRSDDYNLNELVLANSTELKRIAKEKRIYGFIVTNAAPQDLRRLMDEELVETVTIADVELDFGQPF